MNNKYKRLKNNFDEFERECFRLGYDLENLANKKLSKEEEEKLTATEIIISIFALSFLGLLCFVFLSLG
tara:strand:+ start:1205 stop:1411 length:207 start_codon:yes stop_codon:yes gene_type:complete